MFPESISVLFQKRPNLDWALCRLFKQDRLSLPTLLPDRLFDNFSSRSVELNEVPRGQWSASLSDVVMLLKIVRCGEPARLLEVGSYRGYTALLLAQHMNEEATLVTVDQDERHGEAYRDTPYAECIERRVGTTGNGVLDDEENTYDFIFLDAGHRYEEVKHDTELLLPLLSSEGFLLWHDYANWGYFNRINGVPEYLHQLSNDIPIAQISGTDLAIHPPRWKTSERDAFEDALVQDEGAPWKTERLRG